TPLRTDRDGYGRCAGPSTSPYVGTCVWACRLGAAGRWSRPSPHRLRHRTYSDRTATPSVHWLASCRGCETAHGATVPPATSPTGEAVGPDPVLGRPRSVDVG